jgi:hypothetical protein
MLGTKGSAEVCIRRERRDDPLNIASGECIVVPADDIGGLFGPRLKYGRANVASFVEWPLARVRAKHDGLVVGRLGDDRHRPGQSAVLVVDVRDQLDHSSRADGGRSDSFGTGVHAVQPRPTLAHELVEVPVAANLARVRVVDDHLTGPGVLERMRVTVAQRRQVLRNRVGLSRGARLSAGKLNRAREVRKPRHRSVCPLSAARPLLGRHV